MASNFYDAYTQGLEAELARLRGELATLAKERDALINRARPLAEQASGFLDDMSGINYQEFTEWIQEKKLEGKHFGACFQLIALVTAHDEARRADGDVMLNPEGEG